MSHITNPISSIEGYRAELATIAAELETAPLRQTIEDVTRVSDLEARLGKLRNKISLLIPSRLQQATPSRDISLIKAEILTLEKEVNECLAVVKDKYKQIFRPNQTKANGQKNPETTSLMRTALNSVWSMLTRNVVTNTTAPTDQLPIEQEEFSIVEHKDLPRKSDVESIKRELSLSKFTILCNSSSSIPWETLLTALTELKTAWGFKSISEVLNQLSDLRENKPRLSLFWAIINTSASNKYEVAKNLLEMGIDPDYALSTGFPHLVPKELFLNHENLLFILKLIKEKKLNPKSISAIRNSWNACDVKDRSKTCTEALLAAGSANCKKAGWDNEQEAFSYVKQNFDTNTFLWKE